MKKIFTLAAAILASVAMMAVEPTYESYDWASADEMAAGLAGDASVSINVVTSGSDGNVSGHWYKPLNGAIDGSAANLGTHLSISAADQIDSVEIFFCPNGSNNTNLAWAGWGQGVTPNQEVGTNYGATASIKSSKSWDNAVWQMIDLSDKEIYTIFISRQGKKLKNNSTIDNFGDNQTVNLLGLRVWLHETKTVVSTEESLTAVTINDVAISATDLASLVSNTYLFLTDAYVTAPVVKFTKHTVITYDDASTKEKDEVIEVTSQPATTTWGASATINGNSYYVYTSKAASRTVTYMYGEQVLGTETVAFNGNPAEYAQYEAMPLATFGGWYKDADLTQAVANIAAEVISADATYYAKFTKAFLSESVNIEQLVLDYGTKYDIAAALTAANFAYTDIDALDTLNDVDKKANRNYAFLGLKVKKASSYLAFNLQQGHTVKVRMGNIGQAFTIKVNGAALDLATATLANASVNDVNAWEYTATDADALIEFTGFAASKTVVFKQIMIDADIQIPNLPAASAYALTLAAVENGTLAVKVNDAAIDLSKKNVLVGATVTITATPAEDYKLVEVLVNNVPLNAVEGVYSFEMPAEEVTVSATFELATGINNTEAEVKVNKFFQNGQLFIEKNGVIYNAQGAVVR